MELLESVGPRPRQARYQAALRPDKKCIPIIRHFPSRSQVGQRIRRGQITNAEARPCKVQDFLAARASRRGLFLFSYGHSMSKTLLALNGSREGSLPKGCARSSLRFSCYSHPLFRVGAHRPATDGGKDVAETVKSIFLIVSALFPIVNPIGGGPVFLGLTSGDSRKSRKLLARSVAINSFILLVASFAIGTHVLAFFGISLPVVQVGGGLIVISTGWAMLNRSEDAEDERHSVRRGVRKADVLGSAFYPLTMPLTVGPGSIATAITLGANEPRHFGANLLSLLAAAIGSAIIAVSIYLCYGFADRLAAAIGAAGMNVIVRLCSFFVVCIGVQILWNGASALLKSAMHLPT
jgi:multiple antibiotic resistance protein